MKLYLVRHGDALTEKADPVRRLSEKGRAEVSRVADFLADTAINISLVIHSGKKRAEQTAHLLAETISPSAEMKQRTDIAPLDEISAFKKCIPELKGDTLVVGHLPYLGKLISSLVCGREDPPIVSLQSATVVCLEQQENGNWAIAWMIGPELLEK